MSLTARAPGGLRLPAGRFAGGLAGALLLACLPGPLLWLGAEPAALAARADQPTALALGTDGTLLIAGALGRLGLAPLPALWAASWAALPVLAALPLRAPGDRRRGAGLGAALACNPLVLLACASGYGWAAVGFYALWSSVLGLPDRTPHQGLVRLGLGVLAAMVFCPAPAALFLPLFAVLFLAAPRAMAGRHMAAVYLLAFVPVVGWTLTLAYAQWRAGSLGAGPLQGPSLDALPFLPAGLVAAALCAHSARGRPRRVRPRHDRRRTAVAGGRVTVRDRPATGPRMDALEPLRGCRYWLMDGLGNDFVVCDIRQAGRQAGRMSGEAAQVLGDRSGPFGCDQIITLEDGDGLPRMGIWNADGSEAGACGNAARCVAWLLMEEDGEAAVAFAAPSGVLMAERLGLRRVAVDMGKPETRWDKIPLAEEHQDTRYLNVKLGPIDAPVLWGPAGVSMGNPHCVFFVDDIEAHALDRFGPMIEHHPLFPKGVNVSLAQVRSPHDLRVRTWERGVGITKACGTAACAALVSGARRRACARKASVELDGGLLGIEWSEDDRVTMAGPVSLNGSGTF